jgi:hypothetical protein
MAEDAVPVQVDVWTDRPDETDDLYSELRGVAGIAVRAVSPLAEPGEQGAAFDMLTVALSSGAITTFLQIIKTMAEAKGPKFVLKIRQGRNQLKITADNLDEVEPAIRDLFDGR